MQHYICMASDFDNQGWCTRRGLVVVGSPNTLSSDGGWRAWIRWVRDHGAFATANSLPLCPWESPEDGDALLAGIDTSELAPLPEVEDPAATAGGPGNATVSGDEFGFDAARWGAVEDVGVYAQSEGEKQGGQMRKALKDVVLEEGSAPEGESGDDE